MIDLEFFENINKQTLTPPNPQISVDDLMFSFNEGIELFETFNVVYNIPGGTPCGNVQKSRKSADLTLKSMGREELVSNLIVECYKLQDICCAWNCLPPYIIILTL